jgi:transcriptional/translational regulatory protein YebC/TACO1
MRLAVQEKNQPDPALNSKLAGIIAEALKKNMPLATINKNLEKFKSQQVQLKKHHVEIKCGNRIFVLAEYYTENLPHLKQTMNTVTRKEAKSVQCACKHMFIEIGLIQVSLPGTDAKSSTEFEDKVTEDAIECDADEVDDINFSEKSAMLLCNPEYIDRIKGNLLKRNYIIDSSEVLFIPENTVEINEDEQKSYDSLMKRLTQIDGYEKVYSNIASV